jgi:hypothetical protein
MIKNDIELQATQERINLFRQMIDAIRKTEKNPENYHASAGGFLAEIEKMNLEVREYLSLHPTELCDEQEQIAA